MERGNLNGDVKRKGPSVRARPKVSKHHFRGGPDRSSVEALVMRVERRGWAIQIIYVNNSTNVEEDYIKESKSQPISRRMAWNAFKSVKANRGLNRHFIPTPLVIVLDAEQLWMFGWILTKRTSVSKVCGRSGFALSNF